MKKTKLLPITNLPSCKNLKLSDYDFGEKWFPESENKRYYISAQYTGNDENYDYDGICILTYTRTDYSTKYKIKSVNKRKKLITLVKIK